MKRLGSRGLLALSFSTFALLVLGGCASEEIPHECEMGWFSCGAPSRTFHEEKKRASVEMFTLDCDRTGDSNGYGRQYSCRLRGD